MAAEVFHSDYLLIHTVHSRSLAGFAPQPLTDANLPHHVDRVTICR
jgi:hypothetical protein